MWTIEKYTEWTHEPKMHATWLKSCATSTEDLWTTVINPVKGVCTGWLKNVLPVWEIIPANVLVLQR